MSWASKAKHLEKLTVDNSPAILTAVGVAGVVTTAVLTGKGTLKATRILDEEDRQISIRLTGEDDHVFEMARKEMLRLTWKCYVPAVGMGVVTIVAIVGANQIGTRRAAGMAAAYALTEKAFVEYKDKVVETIGKKQEQGIRDEVQRDRVKANPPSSEIIIASDKVLFYDSYTGRYFTSTMEEVKKAQNDTNFQLIHDNYASLSDFYERVGLPATDSSEEVGWNIDKQLDIEFSAQMTEDQRPCIAIAFHVQPVRGYYRIH